MFKQSCMSGKPPALAQRIESARVYLFPSRGHLCAVYVWPTGRTKKPYYCRADTPEQVADFVAQCVKVGWEKNARIKTIQDQRKAAQQADLDTMREYCQPGAMFHTCWGYDQTNVEFFQVVERVSRDFVIIRELGQDTEETGFMSWDTSPKAGQYIGPALKKRIQAHGLRISQCRTAWPGGGQRHASGYA